MTEQLIILLFIMFIAYLKIDEAKENCVDIAFETSFNS